MNEAVRAPVSEAEAAEIIAEAFEAATPLEISGGGTRAGIGHPVQATATLTARHFSGITDYNPAELVMTAKAGTPMSEIDAALAKAGQRLVFEPMDHRKLLGSRGEPTVGGVVAGNISGPRRIQAGAARDSLLGVRFVNGRGDIVKNGGRVMKNVTGLDLVKLMAGSWGTLGFLTEVTLKVLPVTETETTLVVRGLTEEEAAATMAIAMGTSAEISGAAHLPESVTGRVIEGGLSGSASTVLRLEGFADSVRHRVSYLSVLFAKSGELQKLDANVSRKLWREIRDCLPFADGTAKPVWRVSMAPTEAWKMVGELRMQAGADAFYDWQGGLVWLRMEEITDPAADMLRPLIRKYGGGHATLVRADTVIRATVPVFEPQAAPVEALSARIRRQFDPKGIFNPGRMASSR